MRTSRRSIGTLAPVIAFGAIASLPAEPAEGGAWTRPLGETQIITTVGRQEVPFREADDAMGDAAANTFQVYAEHGVLDGLTLGGSFWLDLAPTDLSRGSASLGAFARQRLWRSDRGSVAAVQLGAAAPVENWIDAEFARSKPFSTLDIGIRALYGRSWWGDWGSAFLSTEGGYHLRFEDQPDELRLDATLGFEPWDCCMGMLSFYGLQPIREGPTDSSLRVSPSLAWHFRRPSDDEPGGGRSSVQIGATYDLLQPEDGFGIFLGLWQQF